MTSGHLISYGNLTLLRNVNAYKLIYAGAYIIAVFSCKYFYVYNYTCFSVRHSERRISYLSCLFTEYGSEKSFFRRKFCFSLRSNFSYKYIVGTNFRTDTNNSSFIKVAESVLADIGNISCYFFGSEFSVSCFCLKLFNMNRSIHVFLYKFFT